MSLFSKNNDREYIAYLEKEVHYLGALLKDKLTEAKNPNYLPRPHIRSELHSNLHEKFRFRLYGKEIQVIDYIKL